MALPAKLRSGQRRKRVNDRMNRMDRMPDLRLKEIWNRNDLGGTIPEMTQDPNSARASNGKMLEYDENGPVR